MRSRGHRRAPRALPRPHGLAELLLGGLGKTSLLDGKDGGLTPGQPLDMLEVRLQRIHVDA
eukprot:9919294-Lingulodinium_polyedra.AAC.1